MINTTLLVAALAVCQQVHETEIQTAEAELKCMKVYAKCLKENTVNECVNKLAGKRYD